MESYPAHFSRIIELLKENPRGLTVLDISRRININRNSVAKYLAILRTSGQIEEQPVGPAKVYYLSQRAPIASMLDHSSDCIIVLDRDLCITQINDTLLRKMDEERKAVIGRKVDELSLPLAHTPERLALIKAALEGSDYSDEIAVFVNGDEVFFKVKGIPIALQDGSLGVTIICEDITEQKRAERALRESEKRYRSLFEEALDMIHIVDVNGVITDANQMELEKLGFTREEFIGQPLVDFIHPDFRDKTREAFSIILKGNEVRGYETALITQTGERLFVDVNAVPEIENGKVVSARAILRDVTERKEAEEHLKRSQELLKKSQEMAKIGSWSLDLEENLLEWSDEVYRIFGLKPQEFGATYEAFLEAVHPEDRELVNEAYRRAVEQQTPYEVVHRVLRPDGEVRVVREKSEDIVDENGETIRSIGIVHDITEQEGMQEALRNSEERYRTLFETMLLGVVYQNASGEITSANPAAQSILGLTLDQMQGRTSVDSRWRAIHEDGSDFPGETHPSMVALRTGKEVRNVIMGVFNPKKETYTWININAVPQFRSGQEAPYQVYTTFEDITYRHEAGDGIESSHD